MHAHKKTLISSKILDQGLLNINGNITEENIIQSLESLHVINIGLNVNIYVDESEHRTVHPIWMTNFEVEKRLRSHDQYCKKDEQKMTISTGNVNDV